MLGSFIIHFSYFISSLLAPLKYSRPLLRIDFQPMGRNLVSEERKKLTTLVSTPSPYKSMCTHIYHLPLLHPSLWLVSVGIQCPFSKDEKWKMCVVFAECCCRLLLRLLNITLLSIDYLVQLLYSRIYQFNFCAGRLHLIGSSIGPFWSSGPRSSRSASRRTTLSILVQRLLPDTVGLSDL